MKIELILNDESASFFYNLKNKHNELVIPVEKWNLFIKCNCEIKNDNIPSYITCGEYVITEREWFDYIVRELGYVFYKPKRLTQAQGGFWFAEMLEHKKKMPKHDIFDIGIRLKGSFRSNG